MPLKKAKKMYVPYFIDLIMSRVVNPIMKLNIQLVDATIDTPRERMLLGKISCVMTHATGPQEYLN